MCGITGFIDFKKETYEADLKVCTDTVAHRGPDDEGFFFKETDSFNIGLGHRRLSILDPTPAGHQPMHYKHFTIIFNGEIYNFKEIEQELKKFGYSFETGTDTEMILKAYEYWDMDCVKRFRGMWAFAIYDNLKEELILCRDRMGVKPLYWYWQYDLLLFGSELKSFYQHNRYEKVIDNNALSLYLQYGYITAPFSIFKETYKLEPGHFLIISKDRHIKKHQYWDNVQNFIDGEKKAKDLEKLPEEEITNELETILTEGFLLRMVADVPVGMFLSGGADSSLVAAMIQKHHPEQIKTFTIGFHEQKFNEAPFAKAVAKHIGTDHTELYCTTKEAFEIIPKLPEIYDEPFGDSSAIPTFLVSKLAKEQVKVSLSADGGDELFFGYKRYFKSLNRENKFENLPGKNFMAGGMKLFDPEWINSIAGQNILKNNTISKYQTLQQILSSDNSLGRYDSQIKVYLKTELRKLGVNSEIDNLYNLPEEILQLEHPNRIMLFDQITYMADDILVKVDRSTMAVSLEGREPFLDNKILEYSAALPFKYKYKNGSGKHILKKILYKYVPKEIVDRPKQGFGIPVQQWFRNELQVLYQQYLNKERIKKQGIFNADQVERMLNEFFRYGTINEEKIWFMFMFQLWYEKYME